MWVIENENNDGIGGGCDGGEETPMAMAEEGRGGGKASSGVVNGAVEWLADFLRKKKVQN